MDRRTFLYSAWSMAMVGLFLGSTYFSFSPFADGGRGPGGFGFYGPTHK